MTWLPEYKDLANFIQGVGFPVFVAAYLLIRFEGMLGLLRDAVRDQTRAIDQLQILIKERK